MRSLCAGMDIRADIDSAGTHKDGEGQPPCPLAVETARRHGHDISGLVGRQVRAHDFRYFDLILAMSKPNRRLLRRFAGPHARNKVMLLLDFSSEFPGEEVINPFGRGEIAYEEAYRRVLSGCRGLARYLSIANKALSLPDSAAA